VQLSLYGEPVEEPLVERVDQRRIQRRGGDFAKFPQSYAVSRLLRLAGAERVLDVTYGQGRFYRLHRPRRLVGADPVRWEWVVEPDEFHQTTAWGLYGMLRRGEVRAEADVVVVDPPRWSGYKYNKRDAYNFIVGTPALIIDYAVKAARLLGARLLLHYGEVPRLGRPLKVIAFRWFARYLYSEGRNLSYYVLYEV
jgi:hypothetical protein